MDEEVKDEPIDGEVEYPDEFIIDVLFPHVDIAAVIMCVDKLPCCGLLLQLSLVKEAILLFKWLC